jgi:thiamine monophosphate kinase
MAGLKLSKCGVVGACMDASDGPTACFCELAERNGVDIIIWKSAIKPEPPVAEIARQLEIDSKMLMLTWGNWELVFTADHSELKDRLRSDPLLDEIIYLGDVVQGEGRVCIDRVREETRLPDISSKRFSKASSFSHGIEDYFSMLKSSKL